MGEPTRTTCPYCGVGCGILVTRDEDGGVQVAGDPDHPANCGRLCSKGAALAETLGLDGRLLHPRIAGRRASWDLAIRVVANRFTRAIDEHGPDAVAFYVSGQLLTEDYYVANKLMKGFIGSANIDTNSRLCMSSSVAGHVRAFGSDTVPGCYEDLELADLVVLVGSNTAWCHPVLFQRLAQAKEQRGTRIVVIDPRRTETCEAADLHLAIRPGTDVTLFNGLLSHLEVAGARDQAFVSAHTSGLDEALRTARDTAPDVADVAAACDLPRAEVRRFFDWFVGTSKIVTVYSQGVNQSIQGTDKVNAIINCHLLTGRIGRRGSGPFSATGQPNAMGGREVGGLATMLAAHMGFGAEDIDRVRRFWRAPAMATGPGLKAVDLFDAVHDGRIKALWIMATNPAVSLPNASKVRAALERCPFVVVSDCVERTDTSRYAHVLLPAATWGERDGTVTNSERCISRQRPFVAPPGEAQPDWRIVRDVARAMGFGDAFAYRDPAEIFREHARLSAFENDGTRDFHIGGLAGLDADEYGGLVPVQWPVRVPGDGGRARMFEDGRTFAPDGRARFVAVRPRAPRRLTGPSFPLVLNTGRVRDQWHTMTRTGRAPRLARHRAEPYVELHPRDADGLGVADAGFARIETAFGSVLARVRVTETIRRGEAFIPMHWNDQNAARAVAGTIVADEVDPVSGQPGAKLTPARVVPWTPAWHGFLLTRSAAARPATDYWCRSTMGPCQLFELAGSAIPEDWSVVAGQLLSFSEGERLSMIDPKGGSFRWAVIEGGCLAGCLMASTGPRLPGRDWLATMFAFGELDDWTRARLLSGHGAGAEADAGPVVCSCFGVGLKTIVEAVRDGGLVSVQGIGEALGAGTNCGSCRPELEAILKSEGSQAPVDHAA